MDFTLVAEPVLELTRGDSDESKKSLKVNIKSHSLQIGEYDVELKGEPGKKSQFELIKEVKQSAEYMYDRVIHHELPEQLAQMLKNGSENTFVRIQNTTDHLVAEHSDQIHVNASILNLCYIQGEVLERDNMGLALKRAAGAISFEMAGTVHDTKQHG